MFLKKRGFSLIEVLVVISILSILMIFVSPNISNAFEKTKTLSVKNDFKNYTTSVNALFLSTNSSLDADLFNEFLDEDLQFNNNVSKKKNSFNEYYELKKITGNEIIISTKGHDKIFGMAFYLGEKVYSEFLGFDDEINNESAFNSTMEEYFSDFEDVNSPNVDLTIPNDNPPTLIEDNIVGEIPRDNVAPIIHISRNGSSVYSTVHTTYISVTDDSDIPTISYAWSTSSSVPDAEYISIHNDSVITSESNYDGDYYLFIKAIDSSGNVATYKSNVFKFDNSSPIVSFTSNGQAIISKTASTKVTVDDFTPSSIKYQWTTSTTFPTSGTWKEVASDYVISNDPLPMPTNQNYYLHILANDSLGHTSKTSSKAFLLANYTCLNNPISASSLTYATSNSGVTIQKYNGSDTSVTIPCEIDGSPVVSIGDAAFSSKGLTNVNIPNSVITIENSGFQTNNLTNLTIPNSVTFVGGSSFNGNSLTSVSLPSSLTNIHGSAFSGTQLPNIIIDPSNKKYKTSSDNKSIYSLDGKTLVLGNSSTFGNEEYNKITTIAAVSFAYGTLTTAYIPSGVTSIHGSAFAGVQKPTFTVDANNPYYKHGSNNSAVYSKDGKTLIIGKPATIGTTDFNNVTSIGASAFYNSRVSSVTLPSGLTSIGVSAFQINQITTVTIPNTVISIGASAFYGNSLTTVSLPTSLKTSLDTSVFENSNATLPTFTYR